MGDDTGIAERALGRLYDLVGDGDPEVGDLNVVHAALAERARLAARVAALEQALGALAGDMEVGFVYDEDRGEIVCLDCGATGSPQLVAPPHLTSCPWAIARALLAAPDAAGAGAGMKVVSDG